MSIDKIMEEIKDEIKAVSDDERKVQVDTTDGGISYTRNAHTEALVRLLVKKGILKSDT